MSQNGASISHHHGVGKIKKRDMKKYTSPLGIKIRQQLKEIFDPHNVFNGNNTVPRLGFENDPNEEHFKL